jgi:hypothetical protein
MNIVKVEVFVVCVNLLISSDFHRHYLGMAWVRDPVSVVEQDSG